jgi:hypothetical protein
VEKILLEIYWFNASTDFVGLVKKQIGELKMRFLPTAPIHIVWYIRNFFDSLEVSKCVLHLKYDLHSCSSYFFSKAITSQISFNLVRSRRSQAGLVSEIITQPSFTT